MPDQRTDAEKQAIVESTEAFERALVRSDAECYVLRLYVSGMTPRSQRAIESIQRLCEEHLAGRYELEVVDIYQQPERAKEAQLVVAPTLVKELPPPIRRFVGDLVDEDRILVGLNVHPRQRH